jgi:hypothetical protein
VAIQLPDLGLSESISGFKDGACGCKHAHTAPKPFCFAISAPSCGGNFGGNAQTRRRISHASAGLCYFAASPQRANRIMFHIISSCTRNQSCDGGAITRMNHAAPSCETAFTSALISAPAREMFTNVSPSETNR